MHLIQQAPPQHNQMSSWSTLADIYDETEKLLITHDSEEPIIYFVASMSHECVNAMKSDLNSWKK